MRVNEKIPRESESRASLPLDLIRHTAMTDRIRSLLLELAGYAWGQSAICWPSNSSLAKSLGKHPDTIRDVLAEAEALGFIVRINDRRRTIVLRWKLRSGGALSPTPPLSSHPDHPAEAPPKALNEKQGRKRKIAVVGQATQGPPPTDDQKERPAPAPSSSSVSQGEESATPEELAEMARVVIAGGPLASFYRVALAKSGILSDEAIRTLAGTPNEQVRSSARPMSESAPGARPDSLVRDLYAVSEAGVKRRKDGAMPRGPAAIADSRARSGPARPMETQGDRFRPGVRPRRRAGPVGLKAVLEFAFSGIGSRSARPGQRLSQLE